MFAAVLKFDPSQPRDPKGQWVKGGAASATPRDAFLNAFDPAKKETWYRKGGEWHVDPEGVSALRYESHDDPIYVPPKVTHTVIRGNDAGMWGGSHYGSTVVTGEAAALMGLEGWKKHDATKNATILATRMLQAIADDVAGSEEPLYHSFENTRGTVFTPGDTMQLPLLASAGQAEVGYGVRSRWEDQQGAPTVFAFPTGTPMVGYSKYGLADAKDLGHKTVEEMYKEFGHIWNEAIIAGKFRVVKVETVYMSSQHSDKPIAMEDVPQLYGQVVHLEPLEMFNPATGKWVPRG